MESHLCVMGAQEWARRLGFLIEMLISTVIEEKGDSPWSGQVETTLLQGP